jgi:hypothetical protein
VSSDQLTLVIEAAVAAFDRHGVLYYIGGSVASSFYSHPRSTIDVDIGAEIAAGQIPILAQEWSHEFYCSESAMQDAVARGKSFNLIHDKTQLKVDVFVVQSGTFNAEVLARRRRCELSGGARPLFGWIASPEDVILHKLKWYRSGGEISERQWLDIANVIKVQGPSLDQAYIDHWANELSVADLWHKARADYLTN